MYRFLLGQMLMMLVCVLPVSATTMTKDNITVTLDASRGITISVDGVQFSRYSEFYVMKADWSRQYFGYGHQVSTTVSGGTMTSTLTGNNNEFSGTQKIEILTNHKVRMTMTGTQTSGEDAVMQLIQMSINPEWFAGRPYSATFSNGTSGSGTISATPTGSNVVLFDKMQTLSVDSQIGNVNIACSGTFPFRVLDYRQNTWNAETMKFMVGNYVTLPSGTAFTTTVEIDLPTVTAPTNEKTLTSITAENSHVMKARDARRIVPTPKSVVWHDGSLLLSSSTSVGVTSQNETAFMNALRTNLLDRTERKIGVRMSATPPYTPGTIQLVLNPHLNYPRPEQYGVNITNSSAVLESATTAGLVCAVQTFDQMLDAPTKSVACAQVNDWPSMPLRAIQYFTGHGTYARDIQVKMMRQILGSLKVNTLLYECEYLNWASVPELRSPSSWRMELDDVKAVIAAAAEQFVEIVPLVNSFGHSEWLLRDRPDLADNPNTLYTYDATNPEVYTVVGKIYDECIELFHPQRIHIGHDEISTGGEFPYKEAGKAIGGHELVVRDTNYWVKYLRDRGVGTWAWADMFLYRGESPGAANAESQAMADDYRSRIDKDLLMINWDYSATTPDKFVGLDILTASGFDTLSGTWDTPTNIRNFAAATANASTTNPGKTLGMVQTTWAGFNFDQSSYVNCRHQYECYAAAAEEMWTGGATDLSSFDYSEIFARQMGENRLSDNSYGGFYCPLYTPSTDYLPSLVKVLPSNWKTLGDWVGRVYSPLPADSGAEPGVVMSAVFHPESAGGQVGYSKLTVPIGLTADTVLFTGATTIPAADNLQIATVTVQYVDKTTRQIPIRVGVETANCSCPTGTLDRQVSPSGGNDADGNPILYHSYIWTNPYPSKPITKMEITTSYTTSGWYLRDITGLRAGAVPVGMTEWVLE